MKHRVFLLFLLISAQSFAQQLSICNWYENKKAAVVLTFDDWLEGHEKIVVPALLNKNMVGTFFITAQNTKWSKNAFPTMRQAFKAGSEIANHTLTHPDLTSISFEKAKHEIDSTKQLILDSIPGAQSLTFAYPMGTKNQALIDYLSQEYIGARAVSQANEGNILYDFATQNDDYFKIKTVRVWKTLSLRKLNNWLAFTEKGGGLLTFMFHSVYNQEINPGWDAIDENYFLSMLDVFQKHEQNLWLTTLEDAILYHRTKNTVSLKLNKLDTKKLTFTVELPEDNKMIAKELTIKISPPQVATIQGVKLNGKEVKFTRNGNDIYLNFNPAVKKNTIKFYR